MHNGLSALLLCYPSLSGLVMLRLASFRAILTRLFIFRPLGPWKELMFSA